MNLLKMQPKEITQAIKNGKITINIVGIGNVGLRLAAHFADANAKVIGTDINPEVVKQINAGKSPIFDQNLNRLVKKNVKMGRLKANTDIVKAVKNSKVVIISVPTPLDQNNVPDLSSINKATSMVAKGLQKGTMVIVASSVYIGATRDLILPKIEEISCLKVRRDFGLATIPERVDPGNVSHRFDNTPLIVGGIDKQSNEIAVAIFRMAVNAEIKKVRNIETAEASKLVENVYRDVNIAFVNELAIYFEKLGIDILEVIDACSTKWNFQPHFPGAGVGGTCIPVNPYYLLYKTQPSDLKIVKLARKINYSMPKHMSKLIFNGLKELEKKIYNSKISILGLTYKGNTKEIRNSPAEELIKKIKQTDAKIAVHDPLLPLSRKIFGYINLPFEEAVKGADCLVFMAEHDIFKKINIRKLKKNVKKTAIIIDGRNIFKPSIIVKSGFLYKGVGRTPTNINNNVHNI